MERESPLYRANRDGNVVAVFHGIEVPVVLGRTRWHPGLIDTALDTRPLYRFAARVLRGASSVVDVGCGAGGGTAILAETFDHVLGVDRDESAIAFAKLYCPQAELVCSDQVRASGKLGSGVVLDVLGQVKDPHALLRSLWRSLAPNARIVVGEARAHSSQVLLSPVRRAYSRFGLGTLLEHSGFDVHGWAEIATGFVICLASKRDSGEEQHLENGMIALREGDPHFAIIELTAAASSPNTSVAIQAELSKAEALSAMGEGDAAAACLLRASRLDGQDPRPVAELARLLAIVGDASEAQRLSAGAVELDATHAFAHAVLGLLVEADAPGYSRMCFRSAVNLAPDDPWIVACFAERLAAADGVEAAIAAIARLSSYGDVLPAEYHVAFAQVLEAAGRRSEARVEARLAHARQPDDAGIAALCSRLSDQHVTHPGCVS